jgi:predicted DNA-binding mobile mystery protein A
MTSKLKDIRLRQLDVRLRALRRLSPAGPPRHGWVRAVRQALGMTTPQLARKLGATRQAVVDLERREALSAVTLGALRRAADALDCEVVYASVPRTSLREMRMQQALRQAERQLSGVAHSMRLEAQGVAAVEHRRQVAERADSLVRTWSRALWDDAE